MFTLYNNYTPCIFVTSSMNKKIKEISRRLREAGKLVIAAGAGMGKDSGMPDFRGQNGFWNNYPPFRGKFDFFQCASPQFLQDHPHHFWGFYGHRLNMYRKVKPHLGFQLLQKISKQIPDHFIITSNVDGHFQHFFPEERIYQVHGSIHHLQCQPCETIYPNTFKPEIDEKTMRCENLPQCSQCKTIPRPNILMFNDWDWISDRCDMQSARYRSFLSGRNDDLKTVVIEMGCGTTVARIRTECEKLIYRDPSNTTLVRINPEGTSSDHSNDNPNFIFLEAGAKEALEKIYDEFVSHSQ